MWGLYFLFSEMSNIADTQALDPHSPTFPLILWLHSRVMTASFFQAQGHRHFKLCLPLALPSLQDCPHAPAQSLVLLPGELDQGSCQAWEMLLSRMKRKHLQQLSVFFLITHLSSCLHNQGIIYVLKLIKRPWCPGTGKQHSIFSVLFWTFWAWNFKHSLKFAKF